jgi:diguanylate cyclase (GGDEF)-like protein
MEEITNTLRWLVWLLGLRFLVQFYVQTVKYSQPSGLWAQGFVSAAFGLLFLWALDLIHWTWEYPWLLLPLALVLMMDQVWMRNFKWGSAHMMWTFALNFIWGIWAYAMHSPLEVVIAGELLLVWLLIPSPSQRSSDEERSVDMGLEGVWEWWPQSDRLYLSKGLAQLLEIPEQSNRLYDVALLVDRIHSDDRLLWPDPSVVMAPRWSFRLRMVMGSRETVVLIRAKVMESDHKACALRVSGTMEDLSEMLEAEKKLTLQVEVDPLTGLWNRSQIRRIEPDLVRHPSGGVIAVHIVNLKEINETYGIDAGDLILGAIGKRLGQLNEGHGMALRFGGAEFLLWRSEAPEHGWSDLAMQVVDSLQVPVDWNEVPLRAKLGIGIATVSEAGVKLSELLMAAELAWRRERGKEGQIWALFSRQHAQERRERRQLEEALRNALETNRLEVYYQPKVDLDSGRIVGLEALSRWRHEEWGMVSPARFIPVAEEAGMIHQLGMQVLEKSVLQAKKWHQLGLKFGRISVNLSPVQLKRADVLEDIYARVIAEGAADWIELEITESAVMDDPQRSLQQMNQLVEWGIPLSMDDFGTGYSAMGTLRNFPFQILKIDLGFVRRMMDSYEDQALVQAIVQLGNKLHMKLVAEGVEKEEQAEMLWRMGCQTGQGYLFSQPRPAADIEEQLRQNPTAPT